MRILVVGAGSTGGYFGGRLAQAGRDVTFLVRPGRAQRLHTSGLQIISPHGDFIVTPKLVTANSITAPFDAVLLTVKAFSLAAAIEDLAPAVGPRTMILPVLNGMKHVDTLIERFGENAVAGCVCKVATMVDEEGRILHLSKLHELTYGERDGHPSSRMDALHETFRNAGFDARLSAKIEHDMWEKWVLLATLGGITCLMRGNIGEIAAAAGGTEFALRFLAEVTAVVTAAGQKPGDGFLDAAKAQFTQKGSDLTSSMYRDLQAGNPVEADQILGDLLARARAFDISTPLLAAAFTHLSIHQNRIAAA
jgi:2-dehydropantoate 2-reductase